MSLSDSLTDLTIPSRAFSFHTALVRMPDGVSRVASKLLCLHALANTPVEPVAPLLAVLLFFAIGFGLPR
jgi:hypothetical protein